MDQENIKSTSKGTAEDQGRPGASGHEEEAQSVWTYNQNGWQQENKKCYDVND